MKVQDAFDIPSLHAVLTQRPSEYMSEGLFFFCIFAMDKLAIMKKVFALFLALIAAFMITACNKTTPETDPVPTHDALVEFDISNFDEQLDVNNIKRILQDKNIRYLYLTPRKHWTGWEVPHILFLRNAGLQLCLEVSPKVRGRGNFDFKLGEASKIPEDSLWFVKNGWTINKK